MSNKNNTAKPFSVRYFFQNVFKKADPPAPAQLNVPPPENS